MTAEERKKCRPKTFAGGGPSAGIINSILITVLLILFMSPALLKADQRIQIEIYGGAGAFNPKDLNLFSRAEEQYNDLFFIQRLQHLGGYFTNDLPEMKWSKPFGFRLRYRLNSRLSLSIGLDGFTERRTASFEGSFAYISADYMENHTRAYDPYRLALWGYALTAGIHYRFPVGEKTDLEVGLAAGWMRASFEYSSTWTYGVEYQYTYQFSSLDGGTLEGDGSGSGGVGRAMVRLSRLLTRNVGFFVETAASLCRIKSIEGGGRETRLGLPGEETWQGAWGIKNEDISLSWARDEVSVPTNYWEGWAPDLRERDFVLNLSGIRFLFGVFFRL